MCEADWSDDDVRALLRDIHVVLGSCRDLDSPRLFGGAPYGMPTPAEGETASILCRLACLLTEWLVRIEGREEWDRADLW
jgi:hypothetical protein